MEVCQYCQDHLKVLPDGRLVVPDCWSLEHGPHEDGVSYSQEIVWDLFNNTVAAADVLGIDKECETTLLTYHTLNSASEGGRGTSFMGSGGFDGGYFLKNSHKSLQMPINRGREVREVIF